MRRREFIALAPLNRAGVLALAGAIYPSRSNAHHADGHDARGGKTRKASVRTCFAKRSQLPLTVRFERPPDVEFTRRERDRCKGVQFRPIYQGSAHRRQTWRRK